MSKRIMRYLIAGLVLFALLALAGCGGSAQQSQSTSPSGQTEASEAAPNATSTGEASEPAQATEPAGGDAFPKALAKDTSKLVVKDVKVGTGAVASKGKTVTVHYTGWLTNGQKFDSSRDRGEPFSFQLGAGQVIPGWDQGVAGMKVGGVRVLVIPSALGYGAAGAGGTIPPNATLVFTVQLLDVK